MEIRRALLLFAIVLILAALVSSLASAPRGGDGDRTAATAPTASAAAPTTTPMPATVELPAGGKPATRTIEAGRATTVLVAVEAAGEVTIPSLGLTEPAEPLTPAVFDVLVAEPGRHPVLLAPTSGDPPSEEVGVLRIVES